MTDRLAGKSIIITGAASGIGAAGAVRFAEEGAELLLADVQATLLDEVVAAINASGGRALASMRGREWRNTIEKPDSGPRRRAVGALSSSPSS